MTIHDTSPRPTEPSTHALSPTPRRLVWTEIRLAHLTRRPVGHWVVMALMMISALLGAVLDAHMMEPVFRRVLRLNVESARTFSYGVAIVMVALMASVGNGLRGYHGNPDDRSGPGAALLFSLVAFWAVTGTAIAAMRYSVTTAGSPWLSAGGLLALYLAIGLFAAFDMYKARNDVFTQRVRAARELVPLRQRLVAQEAQMHLVQMNFDNSVRKLADITEGAELAKEEQRALIEQLKQLSIQNLGAANGSSAIMGVTSVQHPLNPAFTAVQRPTSEEEQ
ncbi:hypothetical protein [Arsenicicoccus bolidensis]|uniref:hypothetical protein n=1 Tax=Arsenicicoccus bolidensis TaxID=229480 RepID=UPI0028A903B8|nr:hypothetical protein [Arsenicicoccus bolidensis]